MYSDINEIARDKYNALSLEYNSAQIQKYYFEDYSADDGPHSRMLVYTNDIYSTEIGPAPIETLTGYLQIGVFLPLHDAGLNWSLNDLATQLYAQFPVSSFYDSGRGIKMQWLRVERDTPARIDGHMSITCRVHFWAFYCVKSAS